MRGAKRKAKMPREIVHTVFTAIGEIALAVGDNMVPYLKDITQIVKDYFTTKRYNVLQFDCALWIYLDILEWAPYISKDISKSGNAVSDFLYGRPLHIPKNILRRICEKSSTIITYPAGYFPYI